MEKSKEEPTSNAPVYIATVVGMSVLAYVLLFMRMVLKCVVPGTMFLLVFDEISILKAILKAMYNVHKLSLIHI